MKIFLMIITLIVIILLFVLFKSKILTILYSHKELIEITYKLIGIIGIIVAFVTLHYNFLKQADPNLMIGKRAIFIWHDKSLKSAPMIDVFCTITNNGANPMIIEGLDLELYDKDKKVKFADYLFLKFINGTSWIVDEFSHPIFINKYSEKSLMIGFRCITPEYNFTEGEYTLEVKILSKNKRVAEDTIKFSLDKGNIDTIRVEKERAANKALELQLE